jgi:DNA (cytosine-5)-methyltransferase 1
LLTGGFPCQPFSVAGKKKGRNDHRHLWPEMCRVIAQVKPTRILGENVTGIIGMELDNVLSDLEAIGYTTWPIVVPACAVDARHQRKRVWILAIASNPRIKSVCEREISTNEVLENSEGFRRNGRSQELGGNEERPLHQLERSSEMVSHTNGTRLEGQREITSRTSNKQRNTSNGCGWEPEPSICRVAYGIPNRSHRLKALGNSIVPQVAYQILKAIPNP